MVAVVRASSSKEAAEILEVELENQGLKQAILSKDMRILGDRAASKPGYAVILYDGNY